MKPTAKNCSPKQHQRGAVLIVLILLMVLAFSTALLTGINSTHTKLARSAQSLSNLAEAKTAVIAYARLSDPDKSPTGLQHRYLPCPDTDGDGLEETPCGTTSAEGWLPWQTLGLPPLRDASGSCFRYYISSEYKQGTGVPPLTSALPPAEFTLSDPDQLISNDIVAIIFSPNTVVAGQIRGTEPGSPTECGSTSPGSAINQSQNLLDSLAGISNASAPDFIMAPEGSNVTFNDVAIWIVRTEL